MLNLVLYFKLQKMNSKYLNCTPVLLLFIFKLILKNQINLKFTKSILKIKTLMLSPFHYKVAKKNLCTQNIILKCTLTFNNLSNKQLLNFIFFNKYNLTFNSTTLYLFKSKYIYYNL